MKSLPTPPPSTTAQAKAAASQAKADLETLFYGHDESGTASPYVRNALSTGARLQNYVDIRSQQAEETEAAEARKEAARITGDLGAQQQAQETIDQVYCLSFQCLQLDGGRETT